MKEEHWSCCLIPAGGGFLVENMLLAGKKLSLLGTGVVARTRLFLSGIPDAISIANTSALDSEVASSASELHNCD